MQIYLCALKLRIGVPEAKEQMLKVSMENAGSLNCPQHSPDNLRREGTDPSRHVLLDRRAIS
jgi:hypothetical protein